MEIETTNELKRKRLNSVSSCWGSVVFLETLSAELVNAGCHLSAGMLFLCAGWLSECFCAAMQSNVIKTSFTVSSTQDGKLLTACKLWHFFFPQEHISLPASNQRGSLPPALMTPWAFVRINHHANSADELELQRY